MLFWPPPPTGEGQFKAVSPDQVTPPEAPLLKPGRKPYQNEAETQPVFFVFGRPVTWLCCSSRSIARLLFFPAAHETKHFLAMPPHIAALGLRISFGFGISALGSVRRVISCHYFFIAFPLANL